MTKTVQSIETRYLGPTNRQGSRIKALYASTAIVLPYDHGAKDTHTKAATALLERLIANGGVSNSTTLGVRVATPRGFIYTLIEP